MVSSRFLFFFPPSFAKVVTDLPGVPDQTEIGWRREQEVALLRKKGRCQPRREVGFERRTDADKRDVLHLDIRIGSVWTLERLRGRVVMVVVVGGVSFQLFHAETTRGLGPWDDLTVRFQISVITL